MLRKFDDLLDIILVISSSNCKLIQLVKLNQFIAINLHWVPCALFRLLGAGLPSMKQIQVPDYIPRIGGPAENSRQELRYVFEKPDLVINYCEGELMMKKYAMTITDFRRGCNWLTMVVRTKLWGWT